MDDRPWHTGSELQLTTGAGLALLPFFITNVVVNISKVSHMTDTDLAIERHPIVHVAVAPAALLILMIPTYIYTSRPGYVSAIGDFELNAPMLTRVVMSLTSDSVVVFSLPLVLCLLMVWCAIRRPIVHTLCVVIGCVTCSVLAGLVYYVAMASPLFKLISDFS